jgi:threonine dehydrogenase-like Zn-dependent dehydrogenase
MLFGEMIVVYYEINGKHINKLCGQNGVCLVLEASGSYNQALFETCLGLVQK